MESAPGPMGSRTHNCVGTRINVQSNALNPVRVVHRGVGKSLDQFMQRCQHRLVGVCSIFHIIYFDEDILRIKKEEQYFDHNLQEDWGQLG